MIALYGDAHCQESAWAGSAIRGDAVFSLSQVVDFAIANEASAVIDAGDGLDRQSNRSYAVREYLRQIERCKVAGIPFLYVRGDHDYDDPPWQSASDWAVHLHDATVEISLSGEDFDCVSITGLDKLDREALKSSLDALPERHPEATLLITHQLWDEWMPSMANANGTLKDVPTRFLFSGDMHKTVMEDFLALDGSVRLTAVSNGSLAMQEISEATDKYFHTFDGKAFTKHKLWTRPVLEVDTIRTPEELDELVGSLPLSVDAAFHEALAALPCRTEDQPAGGTGREDLCLPLVRVRHDAVLNDLKPRLRKALGGTAHLFTDPVLGEALASETESEAESDLLTPLAAIDSFVVADKEPDVHALLSSLLETPAEFEARLDSYEVAYLEDPARVA